MNIDKHTTPEKLERYALLWSLARMVIAALSLFFGAMPVAFRLAGPSNFIASLMPLFWLVSGAAAIYLTYLWNKNNRMLFGGTDSKDTVAFFVMVISGINLGYAAIGSNIGIGMAYDLGLTGILLKLTAIIYVVVAYYLWSRWKESGEQLFGSGKVSTSDSGESGADGGATEADDASPSA